MSLQFGVLLPSSEMVQDMSLVTWLRDSEAFVIAQLAGTAWRSHTTTVGTLMQAGILVRWIFMLKSQVHWIDSDRLVHLLILLNGSASGMRQAWVSPSAVVAVPFTSNRGRMNRRR